MFFKSHSDEIVDRYAKHGMSSAERYCKKNSPISDVCCEFLSKSKESRERFVEAAAAKRDMERGNSDWYGIPSRD